MRKWKRWLKKRHHSAESVDGCCDETCLDERERRCSLPCRPPSQQPPSPNSVLRQVFTQRRRKSNPLQSSPWNPAVSTLPSQPVCDRRWSSPAKQGIDVSGVVREVPTNTRKVSGDRWRVSTGGSYHSRHSSLTDESLISEVIHEEHDAACNGNHRRHVSDSSGQPPPNNAGGGVKNLGKKVEPVSYPGGVRGAKVMAREHRFHAHDDIMPLVEDWYDSWNLLGQTPITDPGNVPSSDFVLDAKGGRGSGENEVRRRTASLSTPHRASDVQVDPVQSAILFRDARGLPATAPVLAFYSYQTLKNDETQIFVKFFGFHKCYDLIPTSAKLVVFDTQLLVKKAFFALVYNGVRAAPLWDSQKQRFVGMLTITDFIRILAMNYKSPTLEMEELEEHRLETWRNVLKDVKELIFIEPNASLYQAIKTLIHNKIHRLPVIDPDTGNVLYILTHKRILRFLFLYINDLPESSVLHKSVFDLNIGTYDNIEVAYEDTPIIEALHKFVNKRISALPIVDDQRRLIDIYAKFDVINLAAEKTYSNLDVSLKDANKHRNEWFEGVHKCTKKDSLFEVMDRIVKAEVHRLVIVDDQNVVCGMISLSDILNYLVLKPGGDDLTKKTVKETMKTEAGPDDPDDIFGIDDKPGAANPASLSLAAKSSADSSTQSLDRVEQEHPPASPHSVDATDGDERDALPVEDASRPADLGQPTTVTPTADTYNPLPRVSVDVVAAQVTVEDSDGDRIKSELVDTLALLDSGPDTSSSSSPDPASHSPCPPLPDNSTSSQKETEDDGGRELDGEHGDGSILDHPAVTNQISCAKEFGKSDSMDSAFEATEEVDDEADDSDGRRVHIQIVDASPGTEVLNIGKAVSCDNLSGEKLSCDMTATESVSLQQTVQ